MKQGIYKILENKQLTSSVFRMVLEGDTSAFINPGQFVEIALPGKYLRRPISVCDWSEKELVLIYKTVGEGTLQMSTMKEGESLDLLTGLGNGFDISLCGSKTLLVGGGVGVPPMYSVARRLLEKGIRAKIVLGFGKADEIFYEKEFRELGLDVSVTTVDGSYGTKGFVTDALKGLDYDSFCACGPMPMLKALSTACDVPGLVSLEERMGCGFGVCVGCTHQMKSGPKRICKDGPVFDKNEVIW